MTRYTVTDDGVVSVPVADLHPYPGNPRQGDIGAICQSLETHGQYRPLVVNRRDRTVLAGNHTLAAAAALGWPEVLVTYVDVDDEQARRIILVDNRTNDLACYDEEQLLDLLHTLAVTPDQLDGTGFDLDDMDDLAVRLGRSTDESDRMLKVRPSVLADLLCRVLDGHLRSGWLIPDPPYEWAVKVGEMTDDLIRALAAEQPRPRRR